MDEIVSTAAPSRLVLFDGVCGFCDRAVRWLIARDPAGRLRFAPPQGEADAALRERHPEIPRELAAARRPRALRAAPVAQSRRSAPGAPQPEGLISPRGPEDQPVRITLGEPPTGGRRATPTQIVPGPQSSPTSRSPY